MMHNINFNLHYLHYFSTKSYVWDDSNKWSNIGCGEKIGITEIEICTLMWNPEKLAGESSNISSLPFHCQSWLNEPQKIMSSKLRCRLWKVVIELGLHYFLWHSAHAHAHRYLAFELCTVTKGFHTRHVPLLYQVLSNHTSTFDYVTLILWTWPWPWWGRWCLTNTKLLLLFFLSKANTVQFKGLDRA